MRHVYELLLPILNQSNMSNPSSPPTPCKSGSILLNTYTIRDILRMNINKKVDIYARIISISEGREAESQRFLCLHDGYDVIWAFVNKALLDKHQNELVVDNQLVFRNLIINESEGVVHLSDDLWTSIQSPEIVSVNYFSL